jgi:hypothetical protein
LAIAGGLSVGLATLAMSCAQILGVADDRQDVVVAMCKCGEVNHTFASPSACEEYLRGRLDGVTEGARAAWLEKYAGQCGSCDTDTECFYTTPTCATLSCHQDWECCSSRDGGGCDLDAGQCY